MDGLEKFKKFLDSLSSEEFLEISEACGFTLAPLDDSGKETWVLVGSYGSEVSYNFINSTPQIVCWVEGGNAA